jgi:hypothetical protein
MNESIVNLPPLHIGYAQARYILRNHRRHDLDAIDAAFEVLVYSTDEADRALCRVIEDEMWLVPSPGAGVIAITMLAVALTCIGVATLVGRIVL